MMYLIHAGLLLGGCFLYYWVMLRNETHFALNRWVLLGCLIGSLLLPLVTVPAGWSLQEALVVDASGSLPEAESLALNTAPTDVAPVRQIDGKPEVATDVATLTNTETGAANGEVASVTAARTSLPAAPARALDWLRLIWWTYLAGVAIFGLHFLVQFGYLVIKLIRHPGFDAGGFRLVELEEDAAPYSFWNRVFLNPNRYDPDTYHQIVQHEAVHVRQRHSLDLMLAELVVVVQWFNPFAWLYRRAIENNLEFLTDAEVLRQGEDPVDYQMSLVKVAAPNFPLGLTTSYNQNLLEKRIAMMKSKKSSLASGWKYLTILPLLLVSMMQFNAVAQTPVVPPAPAVTPTVPEINLAPPAIPAPATAPSMIVNIPEVPTPEVSLEGQIIIPGNHVNRDVIRDGGYTINLDGSVVNAMPMTVNPEISVIMPDIAEISREAMQKMELKMDGDAADISKARRSWTAEIEGNEVCFTFIVSDDNRQYLSTNSRCFPRADLGTLPTGTMGNFELKRAAGTVTFNGQFNGTEGVGSFNFTPDASFRQLLAGEGFEYEDMEVLHFFFIDFTPGYLAYLKKEGYQPTERELFKLAIFGLSEKEFRAATTGYQKAGYGKPDLEKMIELRIHGVSNEYISELGMAGYDDLSLDDVVKAKIHGLSADFVNDMANAGFRNLKFDEVITMAIHGIDSDYVSELTALGYSSLSAKEVVAAKIHGVSTKGLADLKSAGLTNLSLKQARDAAIHGVDAEYIRELSNLGYENIDIDEAIKAKIHGVSERKMGDLKKAGLTDLSLKQARDAAIHGVTEEYVRELADLGYADLGIENVIKAKIHGVSERKIGDLKKAGLDNLTLDDAQKAAIHGVNSDQVQKLRDMGYTELTFDDFVKARIHGVTPSFVKSYEGTGFGKIAFDDLVKLKIHGVSASYINKWKREGDEIGDLIKDKIHRRHVRE